MIHYECSFIKLILFVVTGKFDQMLANDFKHSRQSAVTLFMSSGAHRNTMLFIVVTVLIISSILHRVRNLASGVERHRDN